MPPAQSHNDSSERAVLGVSFAVLQVRLGDPRCAPRALAQLREVMGWWAGPPTDLGR